MEDFGYSKEQQENYIGLLIKRSFLVGAALFSIACFAYITVNAYRYFSKNDTGIKVIEAPADPIKVVKGDETENPSVIKIDSSIYEDIFGTRKKKKEIKVKKTVKAPMPAKTKKVATKIAGPVKKAPKKTVIYSHEAALPKKTLKKGRIRVQIAALTSRENAYRYFRELKKSYPALFSGLRDYVQEVNLGKRGIFYRVQIGGFHDQVRAERFCERYIAKASKSRADCIIVE